MNTVTVVATFEAAHRLPHLPGRCESLHGHSWLAEITVTGPIRTDGTVMAAADLTDLIRGWVDTRLDHATLLGRGDELVAALEATGNRVYVFDPDQPDTAGFEWPTAEAVAATVGRVTNRLLGGVRGASARVQWVRVQESRANAAAWTPAPER